MAKSHKIEAIRVSARTVQNGWSVTLIQFNYHAALNVMYSLRQAVSVSISNLMQVYWRNMYPIQCNVQTL